MSRWTNVRYLSKTGSFVLRQTDLFVPDSIPMALTRTYRSREAQQSSFGTGTSQPYDIWPTGTRNPYTEINLMLEDGSQVYFGRVSPDTGFADAVYRHDQTGGEFYASKFFWNGDGWTLRRADGRKMFFPEAYNAKTAVEGAASEIEDNAGRRMLLERTGNYLEVQRFRTDRRGTGRSRSFTWLRV